jgi:murein L,D-transpeptidase YcbB/YkuD
MKWSIILLLTLASCAAGNGKEPKADTLLPARAVADTIVPSDIAGKFSEQTSLRFDSSELKKFIDKHPLFSTYLDELNKFYSPRRFSFAWQNSGGLIEQSSILYNQIQAQRDNGVQANIPYLDEYNGYMEAGTAGADPQRDIMLTAQYLNYAEKALTGLPETDTKRLEWYVPRKKLNYTALLDDILSGKQVNTDSLIYPMYFKLQEKLRAYYDIEKKGSWIAIKPDQKKYQVGDSSPVIAQMRKKLQLSGDITEDNGSQIYDSVMFYGVKSFQSRYGLGEDGVAGPTVLREMAAPLSKRIEQIIINMERCRWLPNEPSDNIIVVNIPQFRMHIYEKNKLAWGCNVVVGKETNKTVIFKGDMKYVVLSPYWNVPPSIIEKEIKPGMARNKNYLANHNMEWNNGNVRQKPGSNNSLGLVKFLFPNSFNIYLHDTPSKSLFKEDKRAFSHGCIRVSEPRRLAEYLLRNDPAWPKEKIWEGMNSGKEQFITLKPTIPVYIVYFTAFVDQDGKLNFRDDVYKRDEKLAGMLFSATKPAKKD